jgi:hypothetical protein
MHFVFGSITTAFAKPVCPGALFGASEKGQCGKGERGE